MTLSAVGIANLALDEIPHKAIVSLDDEVYAAQVIKRQLPQVLGEILESGEWPFAIKRVALSEITNERGGFWRYAYATPNDMAIPLRILPGNPLNAPYVGPGQFAASTEIKGLAIGFDFEGPNLWTDEIGAVLEYIDADVAWSKMSRGFERALALGLAARIALPITKNPDIKQRLLNEVEVFGQRAMARDLNNNATQNTYGDDFIPYSLRGHVSAPE